MCLRQLPEEAAASFNKNFRFLPPHAPRYFSFRRMKDGAGVFSMEVALFKISPFKRPEKSRKHLRDRAQRSKITSE